jgi:hypothetical protein
VKTSNLRKAVILIKEVVLLVNNEIISVFILQDSKINGPLFLGISI